MDSMRPKKVLDKHIIDCHLMFYYMEDIPHHARYVTLNVSQRLTGRRLHSFEVEAIRKAYGVCLDSSYHCYLTFSPVDEESYCLFYLDFESEVAYIYGLESGQDLTAETTEGKDSWSKYCTDAFWQNMGSIFEKDFTGKSPKEVWAVKWKHVSPHSISYIICIFADVNPECW